MGSAGRSGLKCGASSCRNWTRKGDWIGANRFWMAVLLQPKKGRVCRQNQAGQGHEVDGGGRRPRYSFGKPMGFGQPRGSNLGRKHAGANLRAARRSWATPEQADASHRRPGIRQRSIALEAASAQDATDLCPHRKNRSKPSLNDGRTFRRYRKRWKIECTFAWLGNFRRPLVRYDYHIRSYLLSPATLTPLSPRREEGGYTCSTHFLFIGPQ